jgi:putative Mn2+ efflux pump MntP
LENIIITLIVLGLANQALPVALGINTKRGIISYWHAFLLIMSQLLFLYAGLLLGNRFMYLLDNYQGVVIFVGFFMIGMRMLIDVFKVRKGERTYYLDSTATLILASVAQGINTLLAGLILTFLTSNINQLLVVLLIATIIFTATGILLKPEKQSFAISALLSFLSASFMLFSAVYLGFFN